MSTFDWESRRARRRFSSAVSTLVQTVSNDLRLKAGLAVKPRAPSHFALAGAQAGSRVADPAAPKPTIYISACVDAETPGGWRYNGGIKEYNLLAKLLRAKGYEAFIVTYDGRTEPWLVEHQPVISIDEFDRRRASGPARFVTSWAIAETFLSRVDRFYFWDMELRYTANEHYAPLHEFYRQGRVARTATISRTIQAFHMDEFERKCVVIPNLIDFDLWAPAAVRRVPGRVGYMQEGPHTAAFASELGRRLAAAGVAHELSLIAGDERACIDAMQTCDLYVSMNIGKDPLWGEGCPRTIIESMSAGCVNVSFDIVGNHETVIPDFNAVLVPEKTPTALADTVLALFADRERVEAIRARSRSVLDVCHSFESRWPLVQTFLDL